MDGVVQHPVVLAGIEMASTAMAAGRWGFATQDEVDFVGQRYSLSLDAIWLASQQWRGWSVLVFFSVGARERGDAVDVGSSSL